MRRHPPLRYALPAVLLLGAIFIGVGSYLYNTHMAGREILRESRNDIEALRRSRNDIEYALRRDDQGQVRHFVAELGADPDIDSAHLVDENGFVIAATRLANIGDRYMPTAALPAAQPGNLSASVIAGSTLHIRFPVTLAPSNNELRPTSIGYLYVDTDLSRRILDSERRIELQALLFGGFLVTVALALWLYLHTVIEKRLQRLQGATRLIGSGHLDTRVEHQSGDELDELAANFNTMAQQLEQQQGHLRALRQALDHHAIVSIADRAGLITYVNDRFCAISGYEREELLGQNHRILKSNTHPPLFYEELWRTITSGNVWQGVIQNRRKDGQPYWVQSTIVPITGEQGHPVRYISVRTDITQRERLRQAMELLATAASGQGSYRQIAEAVRIGLECRWAGLGRFVDNGQQIAFLGVWGDNIRSGQFERQLAGTPCANVYTCHSTYTVTDRVAELFPDSAMLAQLGAVSYRGEPLVNDEGELIGVLFAMDDKPCAEDEADHALLKLAAERAVQEIRRSEMGQILLESQQLLAEAQRMARLGSWTLDLTTNTLQWSDEVFRIFEIDKTRFGASYEAFISLIHPDDRDVVNGAYTQSVENRLPYSIIHRLLMTDGRIKWVHERGETYYDETGRPLRSIGYVHDISDRKEVEQEREALQRQLQQAQKMESIGQLTGGIAHDFNNILTAMIGFTELAREISQQRADSKLNQYFDHVLQAGARARDLVAQMLAFGRAQPGAPTVIAADLLLNEAAKMLSATLPSSIRLRIDTHSRTPPLLADPVQLHQVVTNLVINARDAIGEHGNIDVTLSGPSHHDAVCSSCHQHFSGEFVEIRIKDDGQGIPPELRERIFEPFFTTKEVGKGSGMGLAMVHGLVHQGGGHILLESTDKQGSSFRLLLPPAPTVEAVATPQECSMPLPAPANKTIMIIDDEPIVADLIAELLQNQGYGTVVYNDPDAAMNAFEVTPQSFDLVITDQTMPGITGAELARWLLTRRPSLPVILCTGYSSTIDEEGARRIGIARYLKKPFNTPQLLEEIATLLQPSG